MGLSVNNISVTPTVTAGAYTANDSVGGLFKFKGVDFFNSGYIHGLQVIDDAGQEAALQLILFNDNPTSSTISDNDPIVIHANDRSKVIGVIKIATTDYVSLSGVSIAFKGQQSIPYVAQKSELYATLTTSGTPTYAATNDLALVLGIFKDE